MSLAPLLSSVLSVSLLGPLLAAQAATVVPAPCATYEGNSDLTEPFSWGAGRFQLLLDRAALGGAGTVTVPAVELRRQPDVYAYKGFKLTNVELWAEATALTVAGMSTTFASNRGTTGVKVLAGDLVVPDQPVVPGLPPFNFKLPFAKPITLARQNLLLDLILPGAIVARSYALDAHGQGGWVGYFGSDGPMSIGTATLWTRPELCQPGGTLHWDIQVQWAPGQFLGPASFAMLGSSRTTWGPVPLPVDLAPFGAKGSKLEIAPELYLPVIWGAVNAFSWLPIPDDKSLLDVVVWGQVLYLDQKANPFGIVTSRAFETRVGPKQAPGAFLMASDSTAATGRFPVMGQIPVLRF
ncbi:MAG: hypothetical protein R3F30_09785 [Planctomycetota bacterium]